MFKSQYVKTDFIIHVPGSFNKDITLNNTLVTNAKKYNKKYMYMHHTKN